MLYNLRSVFFPTKYCLINSSVCVPKKANSKNLFTVVDVDRRYHGKGYKNKSECLVVFISATIKIVVLLSKHPRRNDIWKFCWAGQGVTSPSLFNSLPSRPWSSMCLSLVLVLFHYFFFFFFNEKKLITVYLFKCWPKTYFIMSSHLPCIYVCVETIDFEIYSCLYTCHCQSQAFVIR